MQFKYLKEVLIIFLIFIIFFQRCNPEIKEINNFKKIVKFDTIYKPSEIKKEYITKYKSSKKETIFVFKNKVDTLKIKEFENSNDYVKVEKYADAIANRSYSDTLKNKEADVVVYSNVDGYLKKVTAEVILKPYKPKVAMYLGVGTYSDLNSLKFKLNAGFKNKREDILMFSYDPFNKTGFVDYNIKIKLK